MSVLTKADIRIAQEHALKQWPKGISAVLRAFIVALPDPLMRRNTVNDKGVTEEHLYDQSHDIYWALKRWSNGEENHG